MTRGHTENDSLIAILARRPSEKATLTTGQWQSLVAAAVAHGLAPLVDQRLHLAGVRPPPGFSDALHDSYRASAARSLGLFHDLGAVLRAFERERISLILLKGASLAQLVYEDAATRPMTDIDLLVNPADLTSAVWCLRRLGYDAERPFDPVTQQTVFQDMPPMVNASGVMLELHWTLVTPLCGARIDEAELAGIWSRAVPARIAGESAGVLSPEDLLLHLCMHASVHHRFAGISLRAFVDIAEVVRHYGAAFDWDAFTARANRWAVSNGVRLALRLAEEWTDVGFPGMVWTGLDGTEPDEHTVEWARHKVLNGGEPILASEIARVESEAGVKAKLAALIGAAFPPPAAMRGMYGLRARSWRVMAWYPYRVWELCRRYYRALWKLLVRDQEFVEQTTREARLREYLGWR